MSPSLDKPLSLEKSTPRLWSINAGKVMVVTDLHGDWDAYCRYRDHFLALNAQGEADGLIFAGDVIHPPKPMKVDKSLDMVFDILALQEQFGEAIVYLCGNHEMPHLYHFALSKGSRVYTPEFEAALTERDCRTDVITFFDQLPFYVRTKAGVTITHAGACAETTIPENLHQLLNWDHKAVLTEADEAIAKEDVRALRNAYAKWQHVSYETLASEYLAVSGPEDPRYNDLLRGFIATSQVAFRDLLWPALFTRCEEEYGNSDYGIFLDALLIGLSDNFAPQNFLVAGHMGIQGGHKVVVNRHLRLASATHAHPREAGKYLLFDAGQPVDTIDVLLDRLGTVL